MGTGIIVPSLPSLKPPAGGKDDPGHGAVANLCYRQLLLAH